jgi:hypothetical protein
MPFRWVLKLNLHRQHQDEGICFQKLDLKTMYASREEIPNKAIPRAPVLKRSGISRSSQNEAPISELRILPVVFLNGRPPQLLEPNFPDPHGEKLSQMKNGDRL